MRPPGFHTLEHARGEAPFTHANTDAEWVHILIETSSGALGGCIDTLINKSGRLGKTLAKDGTCATFAPRYSTTNTVPANKNLIGFGNFRVAITALFNNLLVLVDGELPKFRET